MYNYIDGNVVHTKHDFVRRFTVHFFGLQVAVEQLDISTATVNVLLVLDRVLDDQVLVFVGERWELLGQRIEPGVL